MHMTDIEADLMIAKARIAELERELAAADRHGAWIDMLDRDEVYDAVYQCPFCNHFTIGLSNYCPNCGAKMDKEKNA